MSEVTHSELKLSCPTCQKDIVWSEQYPHRPFCSERCKLIDLGEWANENHKIPGPSVEDPEGTENPDF